MVFRLLAHTLGIFVSVLFSVQSQTLRVVERPVVWDSTRRALSLEYLRERHGLVQPEATLTPRMIVSHWTAIPTLEGSFRAFNSPLLPNVRPELQKQSALNVGIHYLVDRDGTIYRLMPDTTFARHVIGLNHCAIGIENVGDGDKHPLTEAQLAANVAIVRYLKAQFPNIRYLIGHHEYTAFRKSTLWKETNPNYLTGKTDPGDAFMQQLRQAVSDLALLAQPSSDDIRP
jgi:N-acetylmuramoyl-L-alanine amidase